MQLVRNGKTNSSKHMRVTSFMAFLLFFRLESQTTIAAEAGLKKTSLLSCRGEEAAISLGSSELYLQYVFTYITA